MRHKCAGNTRPWQVCSVCVGRIHDDGCTTPMDRMKDCCEARHRMLRADGEEYGRDDASLPMYDPNHRTWC
jgi:hypothetical protein